MAPSCPYGTDIAEWRFDQPYVSRFGASYEPTAPRIRPRPPLLARLCPRAPRAQVLPSRNARAAIRRRPSRRRGHRVAARPPRVPRGLLVCPLPGASPLGWRRPSLTAAFRVRGRARMGVRPMRCSLRRAPARPPRQHSMRRCRWLLDLLLFQPAVAADRELAVDLLQDGVLQGRSPGPRRWQELPGGAGSRPRRPGARRLEERVSAVSVPPTRTAGRNDRDMEPGGRGGRGGPGFDLQGGRRRRWPRRSHAFRRPREGDVVCPQGSNHLVRPTPMDRLRARP